MARRKSARSGKARSEPVQSDTENIVQNGSARTNIDLMNPEPEGGQFLRFSSFPYDIRAMIWEEYLSNHRILHIAIENLEAPARNKHQRKKAKKATNKTSSIQSPYRVFLDERYALSKLFHVCSESRDAAKRFYRVQYLCTYRWGYKTQEGTLYFRPEFDTVQSCVTADLFDFASNLFRLDSRYVGLQSLAVPKQCRVHTLMEMEDRKREVMKEVLLRLQSVSFLHMQEKPRAPPRPLRTLAYVHSMQQAANRNGTGTNNNDQQPRRPKPRTGWEPDCTGPISTCIPSFERLSADPRKLGNDHTRPYFSFQNPVHIALSWFRLLESLEIFYEHGPNYRFMLSYETTGRNIATRDQAVSWVQGQRKDFRARAASEGLEQGEWVSPAMGFWLYPIECVGSLVNEDGGLKTAKEVFTGAQLKDNMSKCVPELCLSRLT
ncbi:hypothetical protein FLONG3_3063 [Fusarium longipes]|uniref:2EXR domain-containing protein n=1 Tax=Fusarium longipes TaxID=694270 RepID=A0A395T297_9HYPO|nr:hypothetical protein FLONG3_3063 [Fusarium longipes]